jgi:hypothetical protein
MPESLALELLSPGEESLKDLIVGNLYWGSWDIEVVIFNLRNRRRRDE